MKLASTACLNILQFNWIISTRFLQCGHSTIILTSIQLFFKINFRKKILDFSIFFWKYSNNIFILKNLLPKIQERNQKLRMHFCGSPTRKLFSCFIKNSNKYWFSHTFNRTWIPTAGKRANLFFFGVKRIYRERIYFFFCMKRICNIYKLESKESFQECIHSALIFI